MITDSKTITDVTTGELIVSFTLSAAAKVAIGLFDADKHLVCVIASHRRYPKGTNLYRWNKKDFTGNPVPAGSYQLGLLRNTIEESVIGFIGKTGNMRGGDTVKDVTMVGDYLYYANGYGEGNITTYKVHPDTPLNHRSALPAGQNRGANCFGCCSDGNYLYWLTLGYQGTHAYQFIYATKADDTNAFYNFANGQNVTLDLFSAGTYSCWNLIDLPKGSDGKAIAPACDIAANGLFNLYLNATASYLRVANKTGTVLQNTIALSGSPRKIACPRTNNTDLWVLYATSARKFTLNSDGTLTDSGLQISGLMDAQNFDIAPDGSSLFISDGGSSQQVKKYNAANGSLLTTYGQAGGYTTSGEVLPNKFHLSGNGALAIAATGKFWVNEPANGRVKLHQADGTYSTMIGCVEATREIAQQQGGSTAYTRSVFVAGREYAVDYSKTPFTFENGAWRLVWNWTINAGLNYDARFIDVALMASGVRLGVIYDEGNPANCKLFVLDAEQGLISTSIPLNYDLQQLYPDGVYCFDRGANVLNTQRRYYRKSIVYTNGVPTSLGPDQNLVVTTFNGDDPIYTSSFKAKSLGERITYNGKELLVLWQGTRSVGDANLTTKTWAGGLWDIAAGDYTAKFAPKTGPFFYGEYFDSYFFMDGQASNEGNGGKARVAGKLIITAETHEFYKRQKQAFKGHYYVGSGLSAGSFGAAGDEVEKGMQPLSELSGNCWSQHTCVLPNGDVILLVNDEGVVNGVIARLLSNVSSIQEVFFPVSVTATLTNRQSTRRLVAMSSFPVLSKGLLMQNGRFPGWTISRPPYNDATVLSDGDESVIVYNGANFFISEIGRADYRNPNVSTRFVSRVPGTVREVTYQIGKVVDEWSCDFWLSFPESPNTAKGDGCWLRLMDSAGHCIVEVSYTYINRSFTPAILVNGKVLHIAENAGKGIQRSGVFPDQLQKCSLKSDGKQLQFVYGNVPPITIGKKDFNANLHDLWQLKKVFRQVSTDSNIYVMELRDLEFTFEPQNISNQYRPADRFIDQSKTQ